jgi:site-specific DNA recombinase
MVRTIAAEGVGKPYDLLRPLLVRAQVHADRIDIELSADRVTDVLVAGVSSSGEGRGVSATDDPDHKTDPETAAEDDRRIPLTIEARLQRAGMEMRFVIDGVEIGAPPDDALVRLLMRARSLARHLATNPSVTLEEAGAAEDMGAPYAARLMRLNFLAPDIVVAILNGRQPAVLTATKLMADTRLPLAWTEQRKALGFA